LRPPSHSAAEAGGVSKDEADPGRRRNHGRAVSGGDRLGYIEQGGSSLCAAMSQKATDPEVLRLRLALVETRSLTSCNGSTSRAMESNSPWRHSPTPYPTCHFAISSTTRCEFISPNLPKVSIVRPLTDRFPGAVAAVASFIEDGLFIGQSRQFLDTLQAMAIEADAASCSSR